MAFVYTQAVSAPIPAIDPIKSSSLFQIATEKKANGDFHVAITLFEQCISSALINQKNKIESLFNLALLYWNIGDINNSRSLFLKCADQAKRNGYLEFQSASLSAVRVHDLYQSGKAYRISEDYQRSIAAYNQALDISKQIRAPELELKCSRLLSLTYWDVDNLDDFLALNLSALRIAEEINHHKERSRCLNNIGGYYSRKDNYDAALSSYEKALAIATDKNYTEDIATALLNLGGVWSDLGDYDNALKYLNRALLIDADYKDRLNIARDLNNIGIATRLRGLATDNREDLHQAEKYFKCALISAKGLNDLSLEIQTLNNLGSIYADLHEYETALESFTLAAHLAEQNNDNSYLGMIYNNIGAIYAYQNNIEASNKNYDRALELSSQYKDGTFIWETYLELANLNRKLANYAKAYDYFKKAITSIEEIRSRIKIEDLKARYLGTDKRLEAYQNLIDLLIHLHKMAPNDGYDEEAFDYLEKAKARSFLDSLEVAEIDISEGINPVLLNREKQIMREIARSYSKLLDFTLTDTDRNAVSFELKKNEDRLESLKREIRAKSSAYADLKYPKVITYDEIRELGAAPDIAYFAYSLGKDSSFAFAILPHGLKVFDIPARKILQQQVTDFRKAISDRQNRDFTLGQTLFKELVQPGLEPGIKKIMIIPDDALNLLPFEALLMNGKPDSWLVRDYMVGYAPSLSALRVLQARHANGSRPRKDLLAIGNPTYGSGGQAEGKLMNAAMLYDLNSASGINLPPLRYSAVEVENISSLFSPKKVTILQKEAASSRWLKSHPLSDYKIIHFATHSVIDDKKPARSAILLSYAPDQAGNGLFQAREIYNLKLNADLVTLSACQTGLGQFIRGEGIEGLSRAFFYAGSSSVLMSLWSVNDQATYLLMERFYRHLKGSEPIMGALRNAKLEMIKSKTLSHPFYWAGFVISGKADARVFSRYSYLAIGFVVFATVFTIAVIGISFRKRRSSKPSMGY